MAKIPPADTPIIDRQSGRISLEWYTALQRLVSEIVALGAGGVVTFEGRSGAVVSASGDYTASEITNVAAGNVAAVTVQAAIDELDTEKQPIDATLTALAAFNTNGLLAQTAADTFAGRTLTGPAAGLTVSNGDGVAGNPTLALANDLAALEGMAGTGLVARTAAETYAQRTVTGTANEISVSNGDGVAGNPTLSLPTTIDLGGKTSLEIPNSAAPTVDADGEIAVDTTVTDFSHGILKYYSTEELGVVSMPIAQFSSPTDGHVVTYNGTNDEFVLAAPSSSGGIVTAVTEGTVSAVATLDITLGSADMYEIDLINILPVTDNVTLYARFSQSSSFLSGAADYGWNYFRGATEQSDASDSEIGVTDSVGNGATEFSTITFRIFRPAAAAFQKGMHWHGYGCLAADGHIRHLNGGGRLIANTDAIDGVRFLFSSGNISTAYYAVRAYSFT